MKRFLRLSVLMLLVPSFSGCITHQAVDTVYQHDGVTVSLRGEKRGSQWLTRGYDHPRVISALRIARILATIEVDIGDADERLRTSIMPYSLFEPVSDAMAEAFEKAGPGQELVVTAVLKQRRLGIFHKKYLTSFVSYLKGDELNVHLSRVNWEVPKNREDKLPVPYIGDSVMSFRVSPEKGMRRLGSQGIAARWRDPAFGKTARGPRQSGDGVRTRTILMDDRLPAGERDRALTPEEIQALPPEKIEALERLQDQRESGEITEDEYLRARDDLLLQ